MRVCAFTSVCTEDCNWIPQYVAEMERLRMPFAVQFDRWDWNRSTSRSMLIRSPSCAGATYSNRGEFNETHKQKVFDFVLSLGSIDWLMPVDIDETFEERAIEKIEELLVAQPSSVNLVSVRWLNLWDSEDRVRIDGPFNNGRRDKFYRANPGDNLKWIYKSKVVNGPSLVDPNDVKHPANEVRSDLVCLHHGMKTRKLREEHKERWDRIYTKAGGNNPYGFWDYALNEKDYPPVTVPLKELIV